MALSPGELCEICAEPATCEHATILQGPPTPDGFSTTHLLAAYPSCDRHAVNLSEVLMSMAAELDMYGSEFVRRDTLARLLHELAACLPFMLSIGAASGTGPPTAIGEDGVVKGVPTSRPGEHLA